MIRRTWLSATISEWRRPLAWCAILSPIVIGLCVMVSHWVPVPYWDEWKTPGEQIASYYRGTLTFTELCSQHNESRKIFPRLIYLPLALATHWDVRWMMALSFGYVCAGAALLYRVARRTCASPTSAAWCFAVVNLWLFWPRQYESFLLGIQGELFTPAFAIAAACLINVSRLPLWSKTIANAALAFISTYTVANGMLVWLLAFPLESPRSRDSVMPVNGRRMRVASRVGYVVGAAASIGCYFHGYQHPPLSPPFVWSLSRWPELAVFVARWLGDITMVRNPVLAGFAIASLFLCLAVTAVVFGQRRGGWQNHYAWILLGCYTLVSGCVTAAGRIGFGASAAAHFRYAPFTVFIYIAVVGLAVGVYESAFKGTRSAHVARFAAGVAIAALVVLWFSAFAKERSILRDSQQDRERALLAVQWSEAVPRNPDLELLVSPYPTTADVIRALAQHDALRPRLIAPPLAAAIQQAPAAQDDSAGALASVVRGPTGLHCAGWARLPHRNAPASCVVLGYETPDGTWQPWTVLNVTTARADSRPPGDAPEARFAFARFTRSRDLPPSGVTFRAWAIDLETERAFPMAGAITLTAP